MENSTHIAEHRNHRHIMHIFLKKNYRKINKRYKVVQPVDLMGVFRRDTATRLLQSRESRFEQAPVVLQKTVCHGSTYADGGRVTYDINHFKA